MDDDHVYAHQGEELCGDRFYLLDPPHPSKSHRPGFPLDALSAQIATGRYYPTCRRG